jgi:hypothetical protein
MLEPIVKLSIMLEAPLITALRPNIDMPEPNLRPDLTLQVLPAPNGLRIERLEPRRANPRIDSADPKFTYDRTLTLPQARVVERIDIALPQIMSPIRLAEPDIRAHPAIEKLLPHLAAPRRERVDAR